MKICSDLPIRTASRFLHGSDEEFHKQIQKSVGELRQILPNPLLLGLAAHLIYRNFYKGLWL